jgi:hypothetical protein
MKTARELEPLTSLEFGETIQKIVERHETVADCDTVSMILKIHPETIPCIAYILLHGKEHFGGESAVPGLCPTALRELVELLICCGIEVGLKLSGEGNKRWRN